MSKTLIKKIGYSNQSVIQSLTKDEVNSALASPEITQRLEKFAYQVQKIAPKSDDFLYFTIIFLKSAEAALIDEVGNLKKVGHDNAWGYFDENYRWHGNVRPHKNNNSDIFPEAELKKAARNWIGKALCVDHKSDSVDGVRGIILDTYYDEKLKQVVGLCALDQVNYPDLARKVKSGIVRYGSMGTGVETSICADCYNRAKTPQEYCPCIQKRSSYGEINIGLKPIEYSLVVQPAEPGAILLRTIASIKNHKQELKSFGIDDLDSFTSQLNEKQAQDLDLILHDACGKNGCSLEKRNKIIHSYLVSNNFIKNAEADLREIKEGTEALAELARAKETLNLNEEDTNKIAEQVIESLKGSNLPEGETLTSGQSTVGAPQVVLEDDLGVKDYTGSGSSGVMSSDTGAITDSFDTGGVGPESYLTRTAKLNAKQEIASIMEEIMSESKLRKRAEDRRKIAYHFGGAHPEVEPKTFKSEDYHKYWEDDKHMFPNPKKLDGPDGMVPGDKQKKEQQKRADEQVAQKKEAYHFGGAHPEVEPKTFKSQDYHKYWEDDKQMFPNPKSLGGTSGMAPGDEKVKEQQKRASYQGPRLSTKFKKRLNLDGSINKAASCFEVYAGDSLVIAATAKDIMGPALETEWSWISSKDYAKAVVSAIREEGLEKVASMLLTPKTAQAMPEMPEAPAAPDMGALPEAPVGEMPDVPAPEEDVEDVGAEDPKSVIDSAILDIQERIDEIKSALEKLGGGEDVDINVNLGPDQEGEKVSLSRQILRDLKIALAESNESADELARISESLDRSAGLSRELRRDLMKVSRAALLDSSELIGETSSLLKMASAVSNSLVSVSSYTEEPAKKVARPAPTKVATTSESDLMKSALDLRRQRREAMLKLALEKEEEETEETEDKAESDAHDGIGMKENAKVSGVTTDTAETVAAKKPSAPSEHKAAPHKGHQDAQQHSEYPSTSARQVAEKSVTSVKQNAAEDDMDASEAHEIAESEAEEEVNEHEENMHGKESDAKDPLASVKAKLHTSLLQKKAEEDRQAYRVKVRRAYDVASEMQRKGMILDSRAALDEQVDLMLEFDDKAFESFKRSVAATRSASVVKNASVSEGIGELNIGIGEREVSSESVTLSEQISRLWDRK